MACSFSLKTGVPVKPKKSAFGKVALIVANISPNVERWHSSIINTSRLDFINSRSLDRILLAASSLILLIFWIDDTIKVSFGSMLFNLLIKVIVSSVSCTSSTLSANARYSLSDCVPSSILSIRNITLSASFELAISCADLKDVMVLPEPVVCQI